MKFTLWCILLAGLIALSAIPAEAVDPTPGKLTIRLESDPGIYTVPESTYVHVLVQGASWPVDSTAELVDAEGEHVANATSVNTQLCKPITAQHTGLGSTDWCIHLSGIEVGHEYTGTITPPGTDARTALEIVLTARHNFIIWPLATTLVALALGAAWALWTGTRLREVASSNLLQAAIARNRLPNGQVLVDDLETNVARLRRDGMSAEDLRSIVLAALGPARERASMAKASLSAEIATFTSEHSSWGQTALLGEAKEVQARHDRFDDFYKVDGTAVDEHPADVWRGTFLEVDRLLDQLEEARRHIDPANRRLFEEANLIEQALRDARNEDAVTEAKEHLSRLWDDVFPPQGIVADAAGPVALDAEKELIPAGAWLPLTKVGLAFLITITGFGAIAVATVLSSTYVSNHTFGTPWDYLSLFLAAFGSSAVAGTVAALAVTATTKPK
jgi:hypothetical protein